MAKFQTPAQAQRAEIVEGKIAELIARLVQEAAEHGVEAAACAADAAIIGAARWMAGHEGGHERVALITERLHREVAAVIALRDAPAASEVRQ